MSSRVVLLAVLGALLIAIGAGMTYRPAGPIAAGLLLLAAAYIVGYLEARR